MNALAPIGPAHLARTSSRSIAGWYAKANALADAWRMSPALGNGAAPSRDTVILALCVAQHETACGDAWPGECNWGACTKGALSQAQRAALNAGQIHPVLEPTTARVAVEQTATQWLATAGLAVPADACIHVDSAPRVGPYFTLFGRFDDDVSGAAYFLHVLTQRASERAVLLRSATPSSLDLLARAMYGARYYTGFVDPATYWLVDGSSRTQVVASTPGAVSGAELDERDYSAALCALLVGISTALRAWTPGAVYTESDTSEPRSPPDLATELGVQRALNALGATPQLTEDGIAGPKTAAALSAWQAAHGLAADGVCGAATVRALQAALDAIAG